MTGLECICISFTTPQYFGYLGIERAGAEEYVAVGVGGYVAIIHQLDVSANLAIITADQIEES